jgi:hypothetical protein
MEARVEKRLKGETVITATKTCGSVEELIVFLNKFSVQMDMEDLVHDLGLPEVVYQIEMDEVDVENELN